MHKYLHHVGDYDSATSHLSWLEDMAYTRVLRLYYRNDGVLPDDINKICRLIRAISKDEKKAVETVMAEFFRVIDGVWRNKRADKEITAYQAKANKNRTHGKMGGRPRKTETKMVSENNPDGLITETQMVSEKKPTINHKPLTNTTTVAAVVVSAPATDPMRLDWQPCKTVLEVAHNMGITIDCTDPAHIAEFAIFWESRPERKTPEQWTMTYLKNLRRVQELGKVTGAKQKRLMMAATGNDKASQGFIERHTSKDWREGLG